MRPINIQYRLNSLVLIRSQVRIVVANTNSDALGFAMSKFRRLLLQYVARSVMIR